MGLVDLFYPSYSREPLSIGKV